MGHIKRREKMTKQKTIFVVMTPVNGQWKAIGRSAHYNGSAIFYGFATLKGAHKFAMKTLETRQDISVAQVVEVPHLDTLPDWKFSMLQEDHHDDIRIHANKYMEDVPA
jgi:hypothetical protein